MVVIAGRFAQRLGVDNKPYPFDIMAGTANSSGPFFGQLFGTIPSENPSETIDDSTYDFTLSAEVDLTRRMPPTGMLRESLMTRCSMRMSIRVQRKSHQ